MPLKEKQEKLLNEKKELSPVMQEQFDVADEGRIELQKALCNTGANAEACVKVARYFEKNKPDADDLIEVWDDDNDDESWQWEALKYYALGCGGSTRNSVACQEFYALATVLQATDIETPGLSFGKAADPIVSTAESPPKIAPTTGTDAEELANQRVNLSIENVDIREMLAFMAEQAGVKIVGIGDVPDTTIDIHLKGARWPVALRHVLRKVRRSFVMNMDKIKNGPFIVKDIIVLEKGAAARARTRQKQTIKSAAPGLRKAANKILRKFYGSPRRRIKRRASAAPPSTATATYTVESGNGYWQILRAMGLFKGLRAAGRRALITLLKTAYNGKTVFTGDVVTGNHDGFIVHRRRGKRITSAEEFKRVNAEQEISKDLAKNPPAAGGDPKTHVEREWQAALLTPSYFVLKKWFKGDKTKLNKINATEKRLKGKLPQIGGGGYAADKDYQFIKGAFYDAGYKVTDLKDPSKWEYDPTSEVPHMGRERKRPQLKLKESVIFSSFPEYGKLFENWNKHISKE